MTECPESVILESETKGISEKLVRVIRSMYDGAVTTVRIELNGEGEPVWLTPHLSDPQPEGERERLSPSGNESQWRT